MSTPYFGARLGEYLAGAAMRFHTEVLFTGDISRLKCMPNILIHQGQPQPLTASLGGDAEDLSRDQEEHFLDLHWQSFHCVYPILGEIEFRKYYESLWDNSTFPPTRNPSPLVDSIMAICMQYGSTFLISDDDDAPGDDGLHHVTVASRNSHSFYRRSQRLLLDEIENPSMMTLQSHLYCIIYLYNTSSLNTAYVMLGNALRIAQTIGLEPQHMDTASIAQQQLRCRVWSVMSMLDNQLSMMLGRPSILNKKDFDFTSPGHNQEHAAFSESMLMSPNHDDITWLSFHANCAQLVRLVQDLQDAFSKRVVEVLNKKAVNAFYDSPVALEELAGFLGREVRPVYEWARNVPQSLKISRRGSGEPFSTERTPLQPDTSSPLWLQRQRILLEIIYHHLQLSTFRSFLRFPPGSSLITPLADCHSINCLNHAISLTNILHQILTDTDLLRGWSPIIQYQWDAALCILGFILANPVCPPSPAARKCIQTAINSFEIMGKYFAASRAAAQVMRRYAEQAEILVQKFQKNLSARKLNSENNSEQPLTPAARSATTAVVQILAAPAMTPEYIQNDFDISVDFSNIISRDAFCSGNVSIPLDEVKFAGVSNEIGTTPSTLPEFSGDPMSEIEYSWMTGGGINDWARLHN